MDADTGKPGTGKTGRLYGRHPAVVTADRLLDTYKRWPGRFSDEETDAIDVLRVALERIAEEDSRPRPLAPCGTPAAYQRHVRNGEPKDEACKKAHTAAQRAQRAGQINARLEVQVEPGGAACPSRVTGTDHLEVPGI